MENSVEDKIGVHLNILAIGYGRAPALPVLMQQHYSIDVPEAVGMENVTEKQACDFDGL